MSSRQLYVHRYPAAHPEGRPTLLFVHGAYSDGRLWVEHFIPWFREAGYTCLAVDLSGHGRSEGRDDLDSLRLDDYVDDVAQVVATLRAPPVLIAHSMGSLVAQRYAQRAPLAGMALLAPVPPTGTGGSAGRLALMLPEFFEELPRAIAGSAGPRTLEVMARVYFSPEMPARETAHYLPLLQAESERAVLEMVALPLRGLSNRPRLPVLVMGGSQDAVFPASMLCFTALPWRAQQDVVSGAGHMLMLDPQWEDAATRIAAWLETLPAAT